MKTIISKKKLKKCSRLLCSNCKQTKKQNKKYAVLGSLMFYIESGDWNMDVEALGRRLCNNSWFLSPQFQVRIPYISTYVEKYMIIF